MAADFTLQRLRETVCAENRRLVDAGLVCLTWGNVSGVDRAADVMIIKPSGVDYKDLTPEKMVAVRLSDGSPLDSLRPSSDTATHLELYRAWPWIGGICHTHSLEATAFAQANLPLPCLGTTHADHFHGAVPVCRGLSEAEVAEDYERHTGRTIVDHFEKEALDPRAMPAVLQAFHAPFTWGATPAKAVENAIALEACAKLARLTRALVHQWETLPPHILEKHHQRKHGSSAYYGQKD